MAQTASNNPAFVPTEIERIQQRLQSYPPSTIEHRQRLIRQHIRANGVIHSTAGTAEFHNRPWQLDLLPSMIEQSEWQSLSAGLHQHARLRSALYSDLYSKREVIHQGIVPAQCILAHSGYMRAAHCLVPHQALPLYSSDVTRATDGTWKLLGDTPESMAGCGYVLENRDVLSRVLSTLFRTSSVERLGGFLSSMQQALLGSADPDARCVILGYGAKDPRVLEHSYFAKNLGCTLVALTDLVVKDNRVWLKTIEGLQRVDIILRFVADHHLDPLSNASGASSVGIPGLLSVVRSGNVTLVNPPGVSALANRALAAYHQQLCQFYLNEKPQLIPIPTYWLGDREQRAVVLSDFDSFTIHHINDSSRVYQASNLDESTKKQLHSHITLSPYQFVAIQQVELVQEPFVGETKKADAWQSLNIRTFTLRQNEHYLTMPGGLGTSNQIAELNNNDSVCNSKDVWILDCHYPDTGNTGQSGMVQSVPPINMESRSSEQQQVTCAYGIAAHASYSSFTTSDDALTSRLAENLFWFGRYTERCENTIRLLRTTLQQFQSDEQYSRSAANSLLRTLTVVTGTYPGFVSDASPIRLQAPDEELQSLIANPEIAGTLMFTLKQLQFSADEIRERVSPDLNHFLNKLDDLTVELAAETQGNGLTTDGDELNLRMLQFSELLTILVAITGLTHENLTHGDGWRFITLGRRIERARFGANVLHCALGDPHALAPASRQPVHSSANAAGEFGGGSVAILENLLHVFDSIMTYRNRYRGELSTDKVVHLLMQDESNPRSVGFQLASIEHEILQLPGVQRSNKQHQLLRLATSGLSRVRLAEVSALLHTGSMQDSSQRQTFGNILHSLETIPAELANCLAANYFTHVETRNALGSQT